MHFWYKFFTYLFYPIAPIYLYFRTLNKKEHPVRFKEKLSKISTSRDKGFLIWFHVASVGEAMSILPLIENCIKEKKINIILLTSITLSSGKILEKKYKDNKKICHQFLPLDIPSLVKKFLKHWKPNLAIFVDSEIWPNLIFQIKKDKIPLLLFNARITEKTFKRWRFLKNFGQKVFNKFDLCIASNKESENFLKILGAKNIKNYGNLKFLNSTNDLNHNLDSFLIDKIKNRKIWCAASTHPDEEKFCAESHLQIKNSYKNVLTIIIPRHIHRVKKIYSDLTKLNLKVALYSDVAKVNYDTDILLVDSYGESLKFYNISKCVFVGKSLVKNLIDNSGQNPIEPAKFGCKILHGPYIRNFTEIYEFLKTYGVTSKINTFQELAVSLVEEFRHDKDKNVEISEKIQNYGQNIFNNVIVEMKKYI